MRFGKSLATGALCLVLACSPPAREARPAATYSPVTQPTRQSRPEAVAPSSSGAQNPEAGETAAEDAEEPVDVAEKESQFKQLLPNLDSFYSKLDALASDKAESAVRILWWGDSHTAADFLTQPLREHLQTEVRDGGPGFFRLGLKGYRHGAVRLSVNGRWRKAPILPAQRTRVLDGVFGLGGIRTLPAAGASATAELRAVSTEPHLWSLSYRLPQGAQLEVQLGDETYRLKSEAGTESQILTSSWRATGEARFKVRHIAGDPQIMGAYVERVSPGVVLDTIGINGARLATVLAWEPGQLKERLKWRNPDLLVLAFGTNEVFDSTRVSSYLEHFERVIALAREVNPELPCWIVGPPDSAAKSGGSKERVLQVTEIQREAAKVSGCAFTSQFELMGGEGSFETWMRRRPALARTDRIHLSIAGYEELGRLVSNSLLQPNDDATSTVEGEGLQ